MFANCVTSQRIKLIRVCLIIIAIIGVRNAGIVEKCSLLIHVAKANGAELCKGKNMSEALSLHTRIQSSLAEGQTIYVGRTLDELVDLLRTIPGTFEELSVRGYSGDTAIFDAIAAYKDQAVKYLVVCMDRREPVTATITSGEQSRALPFGAMCYIALRYTAYYEPEVGEDWQGIILSQFPTLDELRSAKKAWQEIVRKGAYNLL